MFVSLSKLSRGIGGRGEPIPCRIESGEKSLCMPTLLQHQFIIPPLPASTICPSISVDLLETSMPAVSVCVTASLHGAVVSVASSTQDALLTMSSVPRLSSS